MQRGTDVPEESAVHRDTKATSELLSLQSPSDVLSLRGPCYHLLMETPGYIQVIDYSHRQQAIDTYWSAAVIVIVLILHPIPQKVVGTKPEAAKHKQFQ